MTPLFQETFDRLVSEVNENKKRYLYDLLNLNLLTERMCGLVGARGIGKTTLMLQYIKENREHRKGMFYFSADNFYFQENRLFEYVAELYNVEGVRLIFIDEVHKYKNWNQELKNLYDSFPKLQIVFSGSSSIDLVKGSYDLSRRAILLNLPGLSFREYLDFAHDIKLPVIELEELLKAPAQFNEILSNLPQIRKYFNDYLVKGFYPSALDRWLYNFTHILTDNIYQTLKKAPPQKMYEFFKLDEPQLHSIQNYFVKSIEKISEDKIKDFVLLKFDENERHHQRILRIVEKAIYEDIAEFYNLKTDNLHLFKKLLNFLASTPPGELNSNNLSKNMEVDNKTVNHYLEILNDISLVNTIKPPDGGSALLRKSEKAYLSNTSLLYALNHSLGVEVDIGMVRETFFVQAVKGLGKDVFINNPGDFRVNKTVIEVGGKNKKPDQIKNLPNAYLVKDGISAATAREIPLHFFGFLY